MKLHLVIEVSDSVAKAVSENAIERVINTSIDIAERSRHPDAHVNVHDWMESKSTVTLLWMRLQDALYRQANGLEDQS